MMKKNLRHLRNLRDLKNVPRKICVNLCKSVKSVGLFPTPGSICTDRTGRLREIP